MPVVGTPTAPASSCTTLSVVASRVLTLLGSDAQLSQAEVESIAVSRYQLIHDTVAWSKRRKSFRINLTAPTTSTASTTVTATLNSAAITAIGTPFTSTMEGYQIRIAGDEQYYFFDYASTSTGTLTDGNGNNVVWPHTTNTTASWTIFQSLYALPTNADIVLSLGSDFPMREFDGGQEALDRMDPQRESTSTSPTHWMYAGVRSCVPYIEVWPVPDEAKTLSGVCLVKAALPGLADNIEIHPSVLTYATAADCYNMLHAKTGDAGYATLGLFYEKKYAEASNDVIPWEVSKQSPPRSLHRRRSSFGRGTDWETSHDLDLIQKVN